MQERNGSGCARLARAKSVTLVEVLAALAILGGSITTVLVAQAHCVHHMAVCNCELTARHLAAELITTWRLRNEDLTVASQGDVPGTPGWHWSRSARRMAITERAFMMEITLEMVYQDPQRRASPWIRRYRWLVDEQKK